MAAAQQNMICAVCREVYRSPRFLPCHHTFCLTCLEQLANVHGNDILCPTCRAPSTVPVGGVSDLQVNFFFTEEQLDQARSDDKCIVHTDERVQFLCIKCDQAICIRCKLTKHEGHPSQDLSEAASRCKKTIQGHLSRLENSIEHASQLSEACQSRVNHARQKREAVEKQLKASCQKLVTMAERYRDQALQELQAISHSVEEGLAADTQRVENNLKSLLQLYENAREALSATCDLKVLDVEKETTRETGSAGWLSELEAGLPDITYRPGLHGDFTGDYSDIYIKRFIGSPVKLGFQSQNEAKFARVGQFGSGECREVHAVREMDDETLEVVYGRPRGDFSKERSVKVWPDGRTSDEAAYGGRVSYVTRWKYHYVFDSATEKIFGSKGRQMFRIFQNCATGSCEINTLKLNYERDGQVRCSKASTLFKPRVNSIHSFDSNKLAKFFVVVDEAEDRGESLEMGRRVVRLYSPTSENSIATYTPPQQPFLPTDVCFCNDDLLLIADWMNDSVHVVKVTDNSLTFVEHLPGSGDFVRPTALNLDLYDRLLIGCGDGCVLRYLNDIAGMYR